MIKDKLKVNQLLFTTEMKEEKEPEE